MKRNSIFFLICMLSLSKSFSQKTMIVSFSDGSRERISFIDEDPNNIAKRFICIGLFDFRGTSTVAGPFVAKINYQEFLDNTNKMIQFNLYFCPVDETYLSSDDKYKLIPTSFDINFRKSFSIKIKSKEKYFNFINPKNRTRDGIGYVRYKVELPFSYARKYYYRLGTYYNQYSFTGDKDYWDNIDNNPTYRTYLHSVRSFALYVGISKMKIAQIHYLSPGFGELKVYWVTDLYADVFYSPIINVYGESHFVHANESTTLDQGGNLKSSEINNAMKRIGYRIGGSTKLPLRNQKFLQEFLFEIAILPGVYRNYYYTGIGFNFVFFK